MVTFLINQLMLKDKKMTFIYEHVKNLLNSVKHLAGDWLMFVTFRILTIFSFLIIAL